MITTSPVRKGRPEDFESILDVCIQDHRENGQFALSLPKVENKVSDLLNGNGGVIGIIERKSNIEALMIMNLGQFWYTGEWCLEEIMNYVRPEYRRSTNAKDMISFGKRCSDELGIPLVIGVVANERTKAKMELYRRQLGDPCGGYFIYQKRSIFRTPIAEPAAAG